jgi:hypothetical protein
VVGVFGVAHGNVTKQTFRKTCSTEDPASGCKALYPMTSVILNTFKDWRISRGKAVSAS